MRSTGFRVEITARANQDLEDVLEWLLAHEAGEAGVHWFLRMREAIESLSQHPHRCPLALEAREFPFDVRQLLYGRKRHAYRILFAVEEDAVIVLHVRHGRRLPLSEL